MPSPRLTTWPLILGLVSVILEAVSVRGTVMMSECFARRDYKGVNDCS
jgi:hypothetical protein